MRGDLALPGSDGLTIFCQDMPEIRHDAAAPLLVRTLAVGYRAGTVLERHAHDWAQLAYASEGVMTVDTEHGTWVVPSHRGVWIPAGTRHSVSMSTAVSMRTLYLAPALVGTLPTRCCVLAIPALVRELILHAIARGPLRGDVPEHRRIVDFLLDQLRALPVVPLELPMPCDARALRIALRLREDPSNTSALDRLVRGTGASRRTLERLFQRETGLSLGRWRQQARLLQAMRLLARGESVTAIALDVGYRSTSAFIAAFASTLGTTPGRYYAHRPSVADAPRPSRGRRVLGPRFAPAP
jgi:AraC-like DNA-binding protein